MHDQPSPRKRLPFRIFSMEGLFGAFALFSLAAGLWRGEIMPLFWGVTILIGLLVLGAVRRRNWQEHWQTMAQEQQRRASADSTDPRD